MYEDLLCFRYMAFAVNRIYGNGLDAFRSRMRKNGTKEFADATCIAMQGKPDGSHIVHSHSTFLIDHSLRERMSGLN